MKNLHIIFLTATAMTIAAACSSEKDSQIAPVDFTQVQIRDIFWTPRIANHAAITAPFCIAQCSDFTPRVNNLAIAAGLAEGEFQGILYDDSDIYKSIEGAAYSFQNVPNPALEAKVDSIIHIIALAQQPDGYLNAWYTIKEPGQRWTVMGNHETYCAGHLIEAAIAYYHSTGKRELLDVAIKFADHIDSVFGPDKRHWVPGHEEIELALVKLYRETGEKRYLDLAHFFLEERGYGYGDLKEEMFLIGGQNLVPVKDLEKITGHAVRAMYLLTGMADYAAVSGDDTYVPALKRVWDNLVESRMYITGGIGSSCVGEAFTEDFDLPNKEAYCETCASVGMVLWNQRMNRLTGDAKYADIMEKAMYNGALDGISLSSDRFFYVNPLASDGNHHRQPWYDTACCPSQISRFLPSVGGYAYCTSENTIWTNLYIGGTADISLGNNSIKLDVATQYPWDGGVNMTVNPAEPCKFALKLRIPGWCKTWSLKVNGRDQKIEPAAGYATVERKWKEGDKVELSLDMPVEVVAADPRVKADEGLRAVVRGPLVYCAEDADNGDISKILLTEKTTFSTIYDVNFLGGIVKVMSSDGNIFVPYYSWDNREVGKMAVWLPFI